MIIMRPMPNRPFLLLTIAALLVLPRSGDLLAQKRVPESRQEITLSFAPLVKKAAPAVVNIYTKRVVQSRQSPFLNDPFFRQFFGDARLRSFWLTGGSSMLR